MRKKIYKLCVLCREVYFWCWRYMYGLFIIWIDLLLMLVDGGIWFVMYFWVMFILLFVEFMLFVR